MDSSYSSEFEVACVNASGAYVAVDIASGSAVMRTPPIFGSFAASELMALITTATTGATATVVTVNREVQAGSATNDVAVGTFTIPTGAAIGDLFRVDVRGLGDMELAPGESISFTSDNGADAGGALFGVKGYRYDEGPYPIQSFDAKDKPRTGTGDIKYLAFTES